VQNLLSSTLVHGFIPTGATTCWAIPSSQRRPSRASKVCASSINRRESLVFQHPRKTIRQATRCPQMHQNREPQVATAPAVTRACRNSTLRPWIPSVTANSSMAYWSAAWRPLFVTSADCCTTSARLLRWAPSMNWRVTRQTIELRRLRSTHRNLSSTHRCVRCNRLGIAAPSTNGDFAVESLCVCRYRAFREQYRERGATQRRGVKCGRKPKLTAPQIAHARKLIDEGEPVPDVARLLSVGRATIFRALHQPLSASPPS